MTDTAAADVRTGLEALLTSYLEENRALRAEHDALTTQVAQLETATARRSILNPGELSARAELADVLASALTDCLFRVEDDLTLGAEALRRNGGVAALAVTFDPMRELYTFRAKPKPKPKR